MVVWRYGGPARSARSGDFDGATRPGDFASRLASGSRAGAIDGRWRPQRSRMATVTTTTIPARAHDDRICTFAIVVVEPIAWSALSSGSPIAMIRVRYVPLQGLGGIAESPDAALVCRAFTCRTPAADAGRCAGRRRPAHGGWYSSFATSTRAPVIERTLRKFSGVSFGPQRADGGGRLTGGERIVT